MLVFSFSFDGLESSIYGTQEKNGLNDKNETSIVSLKKNVKCESSLGLPSDEQVCKFILNNVKPSQFIISIKGNNSSIMNIPGSDIGTNITLNSGLYVITEQPFDTTDIESMLGGTATMNTKTDAFGDCSPSYNLFDEFQNITGYIKSGEYKHCTIINTIGIKEGDAPES